MVEKGIPTVLFQQNTAVALTLVGGIDPWKSELKLNTLVNDSSD